MLLQVGLASLSNSCVVKGLLLDQITLYFADVGGGCLSMHSLKLELLLKHSPGLTGRTSLEVPLMSVVCILSDACVIN